MSGKYPLLMQVEKRSCHFLFRHVNISSLAGHVKANIWQAERHVLPSNSTMWYHKYTDNDIVQSRSSNSHSTWSDKLVRLRNVLYPVIKPMTGIRVSKYMNNATAIMQQRWKSIATVVTRLMEMCMRWNFPSWPEFHLPVLPDCHTTGTITTALQPYLLPHMNLRTDTLLVCPSLYACLGTLCKTRSTHPSCHKSSEPSTMICKEISGYSNRKLHPTLVAWNLGLPWKFPVSGYAWNHEHNGASFVVIADQFIELVNLLSSNRITFGRL